MDQALCRFVQIHLQMAAKTGVVVEYGQHNGAVPFAVGIDDTDFGLMKVQVPQAMDIRHFEPSDFAVLASKNGPVLSIRRFGYRPLEMADLLAFGSICPEMVTLLRAAIEGRINVMISGGTGSGKTTLLNNLSPFIPADERLVTIEHSAELILQRKHVVSLETRIPNSEGQGQVTPRDLV